LLTITVLKSTLLITYNKSIILSLFKSSIEKTDPHENNDDHIPEVHTAPHCFEEKRKSEEYHSHTNSLYAVSSKKTSSGIANPLENEDFKHINTNSEGETSFCKELPHSSVGTVQREASPNFPKILSPIKEIISITREESPILEKIDPESGGESNINKTNTPVFESLNPVIVKEEDSCNEEQVKKGSVESDIEREDKSNESVELPDADPGVDAMADGTYPDQAEKVLENNFTKEVITEEDTEICIEMPESSLNSPKTGGDGKLEIVLSKPFSKVSVRSTKSSQTRKLIGTLSSDRSIANSSLLEYHPGGGHLWTRQKMSSSERCSSAGDLHSSCHNDITQIIVMPPEQLRPASSSS